MLNPWPWGQWDPQEWEEESGESPPHLTETWPAGMNGGKWHPVQEPVSCTFHPLPSSPIIYCPQPGGHQPRWREHHSPGSQEEKTQPAYSPVWPNARAATPCFSKEGHDKRGGQAEAQTSPQTLQEMPAPNQRGAAQPNKCKVCCLLSSVLSKASNENSSVEPVLHASAKCNSKSFNKVEGRMNTLKRKNKNKNTTHTNPHNSHLQINYTWPQTNNNNTTTKENCNQKEQIRTLKTRMLSIEQK